MLKTYFQSFLVSVKTKQIYPVINLIELSVSIAGALLLLLYIVFEFSYDSFHDGKDVYRVESRFYEGTQLTDNWATTTYGHAPVMQEKIPGIELTVRVTAQDREQVVCYQDRSYTESGYCYTEPTFFRLFNFPLVEGDKQTPLNRPYTAVITRSAAARYFGDASPIGKILTFKTSGAQQHFEVTALIDDMPHHSHIRYDFLLSYASIPANRQDIWYIHGVYTYLKLKPDIGTEAITSAFSTLSSGYKTLALKHKDWKIELIPLSDIHLNPQKPYEKEAKGNRNMLYVLAVLAIAMLLIAWVNYLNLTVAQLLERLKEMILKKILGAGNRHILTQFLLESLFINVLAMLFAFLILFDILPWIQKWTGIKLDLSVAYSANFILIAGAIVLTGTLLAGIYPAIIVTRIQLVQIMRGKLVHGQKANQIRKCLVIVQFVASFVLISGTLVVFTQLKYMENASLGVDIASVIVVKHPAYTDNMAEKIDGFKNKLRGDAAVQNVTVSGAIPGVEVANYFSNRKFGAPVSEAKLVQMFAVDCSFLDTYKIEIIEGRGFKEGYEEDLNKVVINEETVKLLGYQSASAALGQRITMEVLSEPLEVIGIAKNYHQQSLVQTYKPIMFFIKEKVPFISTPYISVKINHETTLSEALTRVEQCYTSYFPETPFEYFYLDSFYNNQYKSNRNFGFMFALSALLAVFVACVGLWVISLFSSRNRLREVCLRKVLGASNKSLFLLLTKELIQLVILAAILGTPVSIYLMHEWLSGYAFNIGVQLWIYIVSAILLLAIGFVTVIYQVMRVLKEKPNSILKQF